MLNPTSAEIARLQELSVGFVKHKRTKYAFEYTPKKLIGKQLISVTLPFPPSVNRYWGVGLFGKRYLLEHGKKYKEDVKTILVMNGYGECNIMAKLKVSIVCFEKDKRKRDIDNLLKALIDSMQGYVYNNDYQIFDIHIIRGGVDRSNPRVEVDIETIGTYDNSEHE